MAVTDSDEVLVAMIASGRQTWSSSARIWRLMASCSGTTSITRSAPARLAIVGPGRIRPTICAYSSSVSLPRDTARPSEPSRIAMPRDSASGSASTAVTLRPARAKTSAMPAPIVPSPTTPTSRISMARHYRAGPAIAAPALASLAPAVIRSPGAPAPAQAPPWLNQLESVHASGDR